MRGPFKAMLLVRASLTAGPSFDTATCARTLSIAGLDYLADNTVPLRAEAIGMRARRRRLPPVVTGLVSPGQREGVDLVAAIATSCATI